MNEETRQTQRRLICEMLLKYGVAFVSGAPPTHEGTMNATNAFSVIQPNVFGPDWSFTADLAKPDTAYTNLGIGLGWSADVKNINQHNSKTYNLNFIKILEHTRWSRQNDRKKPVLPVSMLLFETTLTVLRPNSCRYRAFEHISIKKSIQNN